MIDHLGGFRRLSLIGLGASRLRLLGKSADRSRVSVSINRVQESLPLAYIVIAIVVPYSNNNITLYPRDHIDETTRNRKSSLPKKSVGEKGHFPATYEPAGAVRGKDGGPVLCVRKTPSTLPRPSVQLSENIERRPGRTTR